MSARRLAVLAFVTVLAGSVAWAASVSATSQKLTVDAPTVCSRNPAADTHVDELLSASNFGTATTFSVKSLLLGNHRGLVQFDLSPCSIPTNATVSSAYLKLYLSAAPTLSRTHGAHRVTASWTETGATWANQPAHTTTATATALTGTTSGTTIEWDVTADVAAFVAGTATNYGWLTKDTLEGGVLGQTGTYSAREHATVGQRPVLVVTYR